MNRGRENYVGAVLCLRETLYFNNAHTPQVREALCRCFDEFRHLAEPNLKWLRREEPPNGKPLQSYREAKPLKVMLGKPICRPAISRSTSCSGIVIQAGAYPYLGGDAEDSRPTAYVDLNHLLKGIRYETVVSLQGGSRDGKLRLVGWAEDQWLKRLDVNDHDIPAWRAKLLEREPVLSSANSLLSL